MIGGVGRITTSGTMTEYALPTPAGYFGEAVDIAAGPDGNLWFTWNIQPVAGGPVTGQIGRITTSGVITGSPISSTASGIAAGPDGNLWFAEGPANKIGQISTSGTVTEYAVPTASSSPSDVAAGTDGNVWFSESDSSKIGRVNLVGPAVHSRSVTLALGGHLVARGSVTGTDGLAACWRAVPVKIQRRVLGHWRSVTTARTNTDGTYRARLPDRTGTYRARATKVTLAGGDVCSRATSATRRARLG